MTRFFRDEAIWEALASRVVPSILEPKTPGGAIRVWVPGCSTGEEAYSIAILFAEALGTGSWPYRLRIFATDVDRGSIARARRGAFPERIAHEMSAARLQRFFTWRDGEFQLARQIREAVVFASHDVTRDAPFSNLDLVSCRNLLIYLAAPLQRRALRLVHYGLAPSGYLLLGLSETTNDLPDHFAPVDAASRIYGKQTPPMFLSFGSDPLQPAAPRAATVLQQEAPARPLAGASILSNERRLLELEGELDDARRSLSTTVEDLECANEELLSIVDELKASNEELQDSNERMEAATEELQAANEELLGINEELQSRIAELRVANDDVQNLFDVAGNAILLVGMDGRLRRFNDAAQRLFGLVRVDLGLPLGRLARPFGTQQLDGIVAGVIERLVPFDDQVTGSDGRPYAVRVLPYKTSERSIRGAIISVAAVTAPNPAAARAESS